MNEVEAFKKRLLDTMQEVIDYSLPPITIEEKIEIEAMENIMDLIRKHD